MEDQSLEWEIMNYSSSLEDEETETTRLGRLLNTGLRLGKNLVITGVVISSIPLVLPPVVVISALGFACSVPFGVVFASYACSQKLMSKLMPSTPVLPRMIVSPYEDEEEEEVVSNAVDEEEKEQEEAAKDEIEMRIELVDKDDTRDLKQSLASTDERGYLEGGESSGEKDNESFVNHVDVGGPNKEARKQNSSSEPSKDIEKACSVDHAVVNADRKSEGHEIPSSLVKDVKLTLPVVQDQTNKLETKEGEQNLTNNKERENFLEEAKNEEWEKTLIGIEGTKKDKKHQTLSQGDIGPKEIKGLGKNRKSTALRFPGKKKEPEGYKKYERLSGKETELLEETKSSSDSNLNLCQDVEPKFRSGEKLYVQEQAGNMNSSSDREHKHVGLEETWSGQSGTVGGADTNIEEHNAMVHNEPGENYNQSRKMADGDEHSLEVAALTDMPEEIPGELKDADDACKVYGDWHSDEGLCEEKIWKKIDGMRAIMGFKAPRHSSYFEELKALYLFTGIEPPSSSTDSSDLTMFYNKLCFLMSVIGVK